MVDPVLNPIFDQVKRCSKCSTQYPMNYQSEVCEVDGGNVVVAHADALIGAVIAGRFVVESLIGQGASGSVYLAKDSQLKRSVAIKVLHQFLRNNEASLKRFQLEAVTAAGLSHPNITTTLDFGVLSNGQPYIVMEYLQGSTLDQILFSEKQLSRPRTLAIMGQLCDALEYAHQRGLIHRDLKPGNVFLLDADFVKVLDFGLAKNTEGSQSLTSTGQTVGTPLYMSPEQCKGGTLDKRSDIYSLGLLLHNMLTGQPVFQAETLFEAMHKHIADLPKSLSEARPDLILPPALEAVVLRCLSKDPAERYADCLELKSAINGAYYSKSAMEQKSAPRLPADEAEPPASPKGSFRMIGICLAVALLGGGAVFSLIRSFQPHSKINTARSGEMVQSSITQAEASRSKIQGTEKLTGVGAKRAHGPGKDIQTSGDESNPRKADSKTLQAGALSARKQAHDNNQKAAAKKQVAVSQASLMTKKQPELPHKQALSANDSVDNSAGLPLSSRSANTKQKVANENAVALHTPLSVPTAAGAKVQAKSKEVKDDQGQKRQDSLAVPGGGFPFEPAFFARGLNSNKEAIAKLSTLSDCVNINIESSAIDEQVLEYCIERFPGLRIVNLADTRFGDGGMPMFAKSKVTLANLTGTRITDAGLVAVRESRLNRLALGRDNVTDEGIKSLSGVPLVVLVLRGTAITNHAGEQLAKMPFLRSLSLARTSIGDQCVKQIAGLQYLRELDLSGTQITDGCLPQLAAMPALKELNLARTQITDEGLKSLSSCKNLQVLDVGGAAITSDGLKVLSSMSGLQAVRIRKPLLSADIVKLLQNGHIRLLTLSDPTFSSILMRPRREDIN